MIQMPFPDQYFKAAGKVNGPRGPWSSEGSLIKREEGEEEL